MIPSQFCEHANEVPQSCPCPADCFCRMRGSCVNRTMTFDDYTTRVKEGKVPLPITGRVRVEMRGVQQFGYFVGLLVDERGDTQAVVRLDHYGLMLHMTHPSNVVPTTFEEEMLHK